MRRPATAALVIAGLVVLLLNPPATAAPERSFSTPVIVDPNESQSTGEPSIDVAPDGTLYIVAPGGPGVRTPTALGTSGIGGNYVWRSDDKGLSWSFLGTFDVPTGGGDADIVVAPGGNLYASGLSYAACSTVSVSQDRGETWVPVPVAGCGQIPLSNDRQWSAIDGDNTVYTSIGNTFDRSIDLIRSTVVAGAAAVPSMTMTLSDTADYQWPGTIVVDPRNGTAYTVWNTEGAPNECDANECVEPASSQVPDRILISVLPRGSTTPPAPTLVAERSFDTFDSFVANAVDRAGNVYVVWSERRDALQETWSMLSRSSDGGQTWSAPVKVNVAPKTTTFPWVTAGTDGRIAVSYYGTSGKGSSPQKVDDEAAWQVFSAFSEDGGRTFTEHRTSGDLNYGQICTSGTGCEAGGRNLLDFFETAIDAEGCLLTTFTDNSSGTPFIAFGQQTKGPGLVAGQTCGGTLAAPAPVAGPVTSPPKVAGKDRLAATGLPVGAAALSVGLIALALVRARSGRSRPS